MARKCKHSCSDCGVISCKSNETEKYPKFCLTSNVETELLQETIDIYNGDGEIGKITLVLVYLALFTGLRRGELMGLEWSDIDFEKNTLEIRQASQYIPGGGVFSKEPNNETSVRLL